MLEGFKISCFRKWLFLGIMSVNLLTLKAQDVDYSQFFNNPTYFNPAYVGLTTGIKARLNYRRQWTGLTGNYHAYNFSADIADRNIPGAGGIGIIASSDQQGMGVLKTNMLGIIPSVRIPITRFSIVQMGALVSVMTRQIDVNNLVFSDQLDPRLGNIGPSSFTFQNSDPIVFPDFSIGGIYQLKTQFFVGTFGFAVHHITQPNQSFINDIAPLPRKWVAHMDFVFDFQRNKGFYSRAQSIKINPGVLYQTQSMMKFLSIGMNVYIANVYAGVWYQNEAFNQNGFANFVWLAGLNIPFDQESRIKLMYSFDMNISGGTNFTGPSHEISLIFEMDNAVLINPFKTRNSIRSRSTMECSPF